ncbi:hypothetical protein SynROS8604_00257 [Synechococcus sp. ROS8604]|nr:hypothetical protein SynROS8604_00257 [Synechococcus sp. ROS8604]
MVRSNLAVHKTSQRKALNENQAMGFQGEILIREPLSKARILLQ